MGTIIISVLIFGYIGYLAYRRITKKDTGCGCSSGDCPVKQSTEPKN